MTGLVFMVVTIAAAVVFVIVSRRGARQIIERSATVELVCDGVGLRRSLADGRTESVAWPDVTEVEVLTADKGPHAASGGVIIVGDGEERGCLVPIDQADGAGVFNRLAALPGFDHNRLVEGITARPGTRTSVWTRPPAGEDPNDRPAPLDRGDGEGERGPG